MIWKNQRQSPIRQILTMPLLSMLVMAISIAPFASLTFAQEQPADKLTVEQIQAMVNNLGADKFAVRQEAMRDLIRSGSQVLGLLQIAIHSGEPESQMRAIQVIGKLAVDRDPECQRIAQDLLAELSTTDNADIRNLARQTISELGQAMIDRALKDLKNLGATIETSQYSDGNKIVRSFNVMIEPGFKGTVSDYRMLTWLDGQTSLTLIGEQINDDVIRQLEGMRQLYLLVIKRGSMTNQSLSSIAKLASLDTLHLYYVNIDDDGMETLSEMKQLSVLRLFGTRVTQNKGKWAQEYMESTDVDWRRGAFLGIYFTDTETGPCVVNNIVQDSAADRSGFRAGDRVVKFAGQEVTTGNSFLRQVANYFPGDKVKAVVVRGEDELTLELELGRFPDVEEFKE